MVCVAPESRKPIEVPAAIRAALEKKNMKGFPTRDKRFSKRGRCLVELVALSRSRTPRERLRPTKSSATAASLRPVAESVDKQGDHPTHGPARPLPKSRTSPAPLSAARRDCAARRRVAAALPVVHSWPASRPLGCASKPNMGPGAGSHRIALLLDRRGRPAARTSPWDSSRGSRRLSDDPSTASAAARRGHRNALVEPTRCARGRGRASAPERSGAAGRRAAREALYLGALRWNARHVVGRRSSR